MPDADERIERGRESLRRMEDVIDRHTPKSDKAARRTRGHLHAAGRGGLVLRGTTKKANSQDK
jgi:hypothetical protein